MAISKSLIKASSYFMGVIGAIVTSGCLGIGIYTTVYSNQNKELINNAISNTSSAIDSSLTSIKDLSQNVSVNLDKVKEEATKIFDQAEQSFEHLSASLQTMIDGLQKQLDSLNGVDQSIKNNLQSIINQLNETFKQANSIVGEIIKNKDLILNAVDVKQIQDIINNVVTTIDKFASSVNNVLVQATPEKVNKYYDEISKIMLTTSGVIIGLVVVGSIFSFVLYKKIDGKLVSRFKAKKEAEKHLRKLLSKYPQIANELVGGK